MPTDSVSDRAAKIAAASRPDRGPRGRLIAAAVVALLVVGGIVLAVTRQDGNSVLPSPDTGSGAGTGTTAALKLPTGVKDASSPLVATNGGVLKDGIPTVAVLEDFQCPNCKTAEDHFGSRIRALGEAGKINVVYYLLSFLDQPPTNESSLRAAEMAGCAQDAGRFFAFHEKLFARQPAHEGDGYSDDAIKAAAAEAGVPADKASACLSARPYRPYFTGIEQWAVSHQLARTPQFFVNNTLVDLPLTASPDDAEKQLLAAAAK